MNKFIPTSCYVVNFYLGERRKMLEPYREDKFYLLKTQIKHLEEVKHSLDKIIFNFNVDIDHYSYLTEVYKITPKKIKDTEVEIIIRENKGISYGAWSDVFGKYQLSYDFYIFNEDDYFFVQHNWDQYLINKHNSYSDCGYLCPFLREPHRHNGFRKYAGLSTGIASSKNLKKIWDKFGMLPHSKESDYISGEEAQIRFSFAFLEIGLNIYDIRDDYRVNFAWTEEDGNDIWRIFWWNKEDLIYPAFLTQTDKSYNWFESWDGEFLDNHKPLSYIDAMECYKTKTTYYGEK